MQQFTTLDLSPIIPLWLLGAAALLAALALAPAFFRRARGVWWRAAAFAALILALANPRLVEETREVRPDIALLVMDASDSTALVPGRAAAMDAARRTLETRLGRLDNLELRVVEVPEGGNQGTRLFTALERALAETPRARLAGVLAVTDGQVHDVPATPSLDAPFHLLLPGRPGEVDRRLRVIEAPGFGIVGRSVELRVSVDDLGVANPTGVARLTIRRDGAAPRQESVPVGREHRIAVPIERGGPTVLELVAETRPGEVSDANNRAVITINGVRDRLRVLLVSGEPHAGERVWRNLLKSDASVDLVHFTILRPPEKQDGIPVSELSLIAFPTRELFVEKISEFDLIIFDRYRMRGILPMSYIDNVVQYVKDGGTVLVAAGPEYGAVDSLWRSPLAEILPAGPTARVIEEGFKPALTDLGRKHPVTEGLEAMAPEGGWGRWHRLVEVNPLRGQIVMSGPGDRPLLVLDRVGEGRIAVLASDHIWLWGRGYEGGGPQLELLRRLAHWMLKEPELEEESLTATAKGPVLTITRRSVEETPPGDLVITGPDGAQATVTLPEISPGRYRADWQAPLLGLYRLQQDDLTRVVAVGPRAPKEFEETIATGDKLAPLVAPTNGGILALEGGNPDIRAVREDRQAYGRGWIGITPRGAYLTEDIRVAALMPGWLYLLLAAGLAVAAWLIEGRNRRAV